MQVQYQENSRAALRMAATGIQKFEAQTSSPDLAEGAFLAKQLSGVEHDECWPKQGKARLFSGTFLKGSAGDCCGAQIRGRLPATKPPFVCALSCRWEPSCPRGRLREPKKTQACAVQQRLTSTLGLNTKRCS